MVAGFTVDPWDPGYATAITSDALSDLDPSTAELDLDIEMAAADWRPVTPPPGTALPRALLVADGVRRIDARVWMHDPGEESPVAGIAASYAAGIVRCVPGSPATLASVQVDRSLFSPSAYAPDVKTPAATYSARRAADATMEKLSLALQHQVTQLEISVAVRYRAENDDDDLLLVDGPLRGRGQLRRTVGYIKTHHTAYLPGPQASVVSRLRPGQRTPVFVMGTNWRRFSWYVRLPARSGAPWTGIVRCEAGPELPLEEVTELADAVTLLLPPLAGVDYKDPRAPQNLIPIGGLEKLLRHRLGDPRLLYRSLRAASARVSGSDAV
ncbi:hypothetical protein J5X84_08290 [Streptosporangiaceae bacterium NEAU-GS5]|nr:hypothetical protein [Streptosporangiaceae bacterium NEAU-GS5]